METKKMQPQMVRSVDLLLFSTLNVGNEKKFVTGWKDDSRRMENGNFCNWEGGMAGGKKGTQNGQVFSLPPRFTKKFVELKKSKATSKNETVWVCSRGIKQRLLSSRVLLSGEKHHCSEYSTISFSLNDEECHRHHSGLHAFRP
jgi:hypothetical protein